VWGGGGGGARRDNSQYRAKRLAGKNVVRNGLFRVECDVKPYTQFSSARRYKLDRRRSAKLTVPATIDAQFIAPRLPTAPCRD